MDLNIRKFPEELMKAIKIKALNAGKNMREYVIEVLSANTVRLSLGMLHGDAGVRGKSKGDVVSRPSAGKKKLSTGRVPRRISGSHKSKRTEGGKVCGTHGLVMKDFGNKWSCEGPPPHSELK
jgi:hypothetical protein